MHPDAMIAFAREALGLPSSTFLRLSPLTERGSERAYFRLEWGSGSTAILAHYDPRRSENAHYVDIAGFLVAQGIPVPQVVRHDPAACLVVMEDLGTRDLWSYREEAWETRRALYRKTLSVVHRLHSFPAADFPHGRVKLMESFGPDLYRWERDYFRDHFVSGLCGIEMEPHLFRELETELSALAGRLEGTPVCLVHRDLQSQNVMIRDGEPFLIDFQGMRLGSPFYDVGSLLYDPYVDFSDAGRLDLLSFYYDLSGWDVDWVTFQDHFWEASAQRLMQALGAYGFLGAKKGLTTFLAHVPAALDNILCATAHVSTLPRLREVAERCQSTNGRGR
jgi:N-acetylmuramate 1-kinase